MHLAPQIGRGLWLDLLLAGRALATADAGQLLQHGRMLLSRRRGRRGRLLLLLLLLLFSTQICLLPIDDFLIRVRSDAVSDAFHPKFALIFR